MITYRTFRNPDPPRLAEVWNASLVGPRAVPLNPPQSPGILEYFTLGKPYFDPRGLTLAFDDQCPVGFVHSGFAGSLDGSTLDHTTGVICTLVVLPSHRRQGIGGELLRRAEQYLIQVGAKTILAGPTEPTNPFTFGLYGGADSAGFLASEGLTRPFLEHRGYQVAQTIGIFQRVLKRFQAPIDVRFHAIHPRYDILGNPFSRAGWYRESALGPVEAVEYRLQEKQTTRVESRIVLWDMMVPFGYHWGETCVGAIDLYVEPNRRQQGLAKYLLVQVLLHLQQQAFDRFEACVDLNNVAMLGLLHGLGFTQVETGHSYRRV